MTAMRRYTVALVLLSILSCSRIVAELADDFNIPKGWRMQRRGDVVTRGSIAFLDRVAFSRSLACPLDATDRFHGFRYEAVVEGGCEFYAKMAQAAADELACFGWVQETPTGTFVGEGRCSKATGSTMQDRLKEGPGGPCVVRSLEAKDYADTKIKLHFSHFKIVEEERKTCFRDRPHQCPEFARTAAEGETCTDGDDARTAAQ